MEGVRQIAMILLFAFHNFPEEVGCTCDTKNCSITPVKPHLPCTIEDSSTSSASCDWPSGAIEWPSAPHRLDVSIMYKNNSEYKDPYLHIEWEPPNDDGIKSVKGFLLKVMLVTWENLEIACVRFNMSSAQWQDEDKFIGSTKFSYDCIDSLIAHAGKNLFIRLSSLPSSRTGQKETSKNMTIQVPLDIGPPSPVCPNTWTTSVEFHWNMSSRTIESSFNQGPEEYHYKLYEVALIRIRSDNIMENIIRQKFEHLNSSNQRRVTLYTLPEDYQCPETFIIYVRPEFEATMACCDCNNSHCYDYCKTSKSSGTLITDCSVGTTAIDSEAVVTTTSATEAAVKTTIAAEVVSTAGIERIIGIIVGSLGGLVLVVVIILCIMYRKHISREEKSGDQDGFTRPIVGTTPGLNVPAEQEVGFEAPMMEGQPTKVGSLVLNNQVNECIKREFLESLPQKKVMLIYNPDHIKHLNVLHHFANFLQSQCKCEVVFFEWEMLKAAKDLTQWVIYNIEHSDKLIFVASVGAKRFYNRYILGHTGGNRSTQKDFFLTAVRKMILECQNEKQNRVLQVKFPYSEVKEDCFIRDIHSGLYFSLMNDLENLVLAVHDRSKYSQGIKEQRIEDLNSGFIKELKKSIAEMEEFVKQHPDWLDSQYDSGLDSGDSTYFPSGRNKLKTQDSESTRSDQNDYTFENTNYEDPSLPNIHRPHLTPHHDGLSDTHTDIHAQDHKLNNRRQDASSDMDARSLYSQETMPGSQPQVISPDLVTLGTYTESEIINYIDVGSGGNPSLGDTDLYNQGLASIGLEKPEEKVEDFFKFLSKNHYDTESLGGVSV